MLKTIVIAPISGLAFVPQQKCGSILRTESFNGQVSGGAKPAV